MSLIPDDTERLARARADLRIGLPVVLRDQDRMLLVLAVETLSPERLAALAPLGGTPHLAITDRRAGTLKARAYDGDLARVVLPRDADLGWLKSVADPADDLRMPMKGPLNALRDGPADLDRLSLRILKSARLLPAALNMTIDSAPADLTVLNAAATRAILGEASPLHPAISARVPLASSENARVHVFRPEDGGEDHYAIEIGRPPRNQPVLARLHSACFTGDILGSLKCDCGPQLHGALNQMGTEGAGVLLYLNQEGRGIGLANKMRAYSLQDQGFDTVEANHRLGFEDDERDFRLGAALLREMGFTSARLLTNNPRKIAMMERAGIAVTERVPLKVGLNPHNANYLATKAKKSGHLL
ncbi:GTP cyclohydrolase II [Pseudooceanicola onchidii]|uniref:GTP cyclohydrolase II n=1 Tax=Pseudooceanicola onchidii TaxID=2562279 RepID=UPI0010AB422A|nr:GTP cyclohydrolase II [Pseudooceanicola onchidii]